MSITPTLGNATKSFVRKSIGGTDFHLFCILENEAIVDYGETATNKEYCNSRQEAYVATEYPEFKGQDYSYIWTENKGSLADKDFKEAFESNTLGGKTVTVKMIAQGGAAYWADFMVTNYKFIFKKGEVNKTTVTLQQLTLPKEQIANALTVDTTKITADNTQITADKITK